MTRLSPTAARLVRASRSPDHPGRPGGSVLWTVVAALVPALSTLGTPTSAASHGLVALATVAVVGVLAVLLAGGQHGRHGAAASPARTRVVALRTRARRAAFLRLRDPDAPGRARPRAPSAATAAA